ncbi:MAG TPA: hypothetical protein VMS88_03235 [Terriglobales bacterium]|nr:hypothetical protein [Terriglobales bacterium]
MRLAAILALLAVVSIVAHPARAGQVRVDVMDFQFVPTTVTVNHGDHVVWTWTGGFHSATSGTGCVSDGIFDSALQNTALAPGPADLRVGRALRSQPGCGAHRAHRRHADHRLRRVGIGWGRVKMIYR